MAIEGKTLRKGELMIKVVEGKWLIEKAIDYHESINVHAPD